MAFFDKSKLLSNGYFQIFKRMLLYAWANIISLMSIFSMSLVNIAFTGHLGTEKLGAASLSNMFNNITASSLFIGLCAVCDITIPQAIASKNQFKCGVVLQKGVIILLLASIICTSVFINLEHILLVLGQDPEISRYAGMHASAYAFGLPGHALMTLMFRYIISQGFVYAAMAISVVCNIAVGIFIHWLFISYMELDMAGSGAALAITRWLVFVCLVIYLIFSGKYKDTWQGWSVECLYEWKEFLAMAIPAMFMVCLELWCAEIMVFISGILGTIQLASWSVIANYFTTVHMLGTGVGVAWAIIFGGYLGSGNIEMLKKSAIVAVVVAFAGGLLGGTLTMSMHRLLPHAFTSDIAVIALTTNLFMAIVPHQIMSYVKAIHAGIIRAIGKVKYGAMCSFISFYVIGLAIALPTMLLTSVGVFGAAIGLGTASTVQASLLMIKIHTSDWQTEIDSTIERSSLLTGNDKTKKGQNSSTKSNTMELVSRQPNGYQPLCNTNTDDGNQTQPNDDKRATSKEHKEESHSLKLRTIVIKRLCTIMLCFAILGVGIAVRIYLDTTL